MLDEKRLLVKIGRNRSGQDAGEIDMEVAVQHIEDLCDYDFDQLLIMLDVAKESCERARVPDDPRWTNASCED